MGRRTLNIKKGPPAFACGPLVLAYCLTLNLSLQTTGPAKIKIPKVKAKKATDAVVGGIVVQHDLHY
jgi:hypothetical protein